MATSETDDPKPVRKATTPKTPAPKKAPTKRPAAKVEASDPRPTASAVNAAASPVSSTTNVPAWGGSVAATPPQVQPQVQQSSHVQVGADELAALSDQDYAAQKAGRPCIPPAKIRVEEKRVIAVAPGSLTWIDKLKAYYKGLIVAIGGILIFTNELTPLFDYIPVDDRHYVTVGIAGLTMVLNVLKSNEKWVESGEASPVS